MLACQAIERWPMQSDSSGGVATAAHQRLEMTLQKHYYRAVLQCVLEDLGEQQAETMKSTQPHTHQHRQNKGQSWDQAVNSHVSGSFADYAAAAISRLGHSPAGSCMPQ